jgi:hypothetical protein
MGTFVETAGPAQPGRSPLGRVAAAWRDRPAELFYAAGTAATALYFVLPLAAQAVLYVAIGLAATAAVVVGAHRNLCRGRLPWLMFAAGLGLQAVGDALFNYYDVVLHTDPFPSVADAAYLGGYPLLIGGIVLLVRRLGTFESRAGLIEAAIVTVAFALVQWLFLITPVAHTAGASRLETSILVAYPSMDVLLVAGLAAFFVTPTWRLASYRCLVLSIVLMLVADEVFGLAADSYSLGSWPDAFWLISYVAWGAAALHPSMAGIGTPVRREPQLTWDRISLLAAALLTAPALLVLAPEAARSHAQALAVGGALLSMLPLTRLVGLVRRIESLRAAERHARTQADDAWQLLQQLGAERTAARIPADAG